VTPGVHSAAVSDDPTVPGGPAASVDLAEALTLGADGPPPKVGVGDRFGRFAVRGVLGIGGMGVVLEGYDPTLDRPVAIKVMASAPDPASASAGETRMVREAKAMAKLSHPNVVRVYEVGSNRAGLYMVMELIDGVTLARWLDEPRPWRQVLERFLAAGRGLAAAHAAELVHRDFKPSNVLLGRDGRVLVSDFGLVSVAAAAPERPVDGATVGGLDVSTGVLLGTPRYMAPEQHQRGAVDPRADQWAFCASLWEGLFGAHPFAADTLAGLGHAGPVRRSAGRADRSRRAAAHPRGPAPRAGARPGRALRVDGRAPGRAGARSGADPPDGPSWRSARWWP
jgi:serine/threonine protein kinase